MWTKYFTIPHRLSAPNTQFLTKTPQKLNIFITPIVSLIDYAAHKLRKVPASIV